MACAHSVVQHGLHAPQVRQLLPYVPELVFSKAARLITMRPVFQSEQLGDLVEAKAEPLRGLDEPHPRDVGCAVAANTAVWLLRLGQQPLALIEPGGFHVDPGCVGEGANSPALASRLHTACPRTQV